jgi:hypothetical protein
MCDAQQTQPYQAPSDIFRYTTEELCIITAKCATSNKTAELWPAPSSRVATLSSSKEAPFDVTIHNAKEGTKGSQKRHKQCPQEVMAVADYNGGNNEEAGGSGMGHAMTIACNGK